MRKTVILFFLLVWTGSLLYSQSIETILQRFEETTKIPSVQGSFVAQLISPNGDIREIRARAYQKFMGTAQTNRLFLFDHPPTVRGTGLLLHAFYDGRPNNMWIYLPAIRRTRRIALESSGGGYFMGSDFTYRDLMDNDNSQMDFERLPDREIDGVEYYVLRARGRTAQERQEHGYSFIVTFYRKDNFVVQRREFYDFNDELLKIARWEELVDLHPQYYPSVLSMENVQTGHRSVLRLTDISIEDIPDRVFTTRYLQNN